MSYPPDRPTDFSPRLLAGGENLPLDLDGTAVHAFEIEAAAGDLVRATAEQRGGDAELRLFAPDGTPVMRMDSPTGAAGNETVSGIAAVPGRYRVEVHLAEKGSSGPVTLHVEKPRPASAEERTHVEAEHAFAAGDDAFWEGHGKEARQHYRHARELFAGTADRRSEILALYRSGWMGADLKEADAEVELEQAEEGFAQLGDGLMRVRALGRLGEHYLKQERYEDAVLVLVPARVLARKQGDALIRGGILNRLGEVRRGQRHYQEAGDAYLEALKLWQEEGLAEPEANTWLRLAELYVSAHALDEARSCLDRAGLLFKKLDLPKSEAVRLRDLGNLEVRSGNPRQGLAALQRSLEIRREQAMGPAKEAVALMDMGVALLDLGELERADAALSEALELYRQAGNRAGEGMVLLKNGRVDIEQEAWGEADDNLRQAEDLLRQANDSWGIVSARYNRALALHRQGKYRDADAILEPLQDEAEVLRSGSDAMELRTAYVDARYHYGELYVDNLMRLDEAEPKNGWDEKALAAADRWRARGLLDMLDLAEVEHAQDPELLTRERAVIEEINQLERQRGELLGAADADQRRAVERQLDDKARQLRSLSAQVRREAASAAASSPRAALDQGTGLLTKVQVDVLPARTAVLIYALGEERSFLWVMTRTELRSRMLPSRQEIEDLATPALRLLRSVLPEDAPRRDEATAKLAHAVLEPAWEALADMKVNPLQGEGRLVVVADGALHYVPFAALPMADGKGGTMPLIRRYEVAYLPSLATGVKLRQRRLRPQAVGVLAALADPVFAADDPRLHGAGPNASRSGPRSATPLEPLTRASRDLDFALFSRLPATARETERIAEGLPEGRTLLAYGFDAHRDLVLSGRLENYRILHFATHGILHPNHPELSGLLLSRFDKEGRPRDGYLRLADVQRLRLQADLAVLSACETGLGREYRGEGLLGLTQGFMEAGVPRLVVSLWRVGDEDTAQLMVRFYRELLSQTGYHSVPDALRRAQIGMLEDPAWSSPHQWAGFVFLGDPRSVALDDPPIGQAESAGGAGTPEEPPDEPTPGGGGGSRRLTGPAFWNPALTPDAHSAGTDGSG